MKSKILNLIIGISTIFQVSAQTNPPTQQWARYEAGTPSAQDLTSAACTDNGGNIYLAGSSGYRGVFVVKYSNQGVQLNDFYYNLSIGYYDAVRDIKTDNSGNIYLCGNSYGLCFISKLNSAGTVLWEYFYNPATGNPNLVSLQLDNVSLPVYVYSAGTVNDSATVFKINAATGLSVWKKSTVRGTANDLVLDVNANPFICGFDSAAASNNFYVSKISFSGIVQWSQSIDGLQNKDDKAVKLLVNTSGNVAALGHITDSSSQKSSLVIYRFNSNGSVQWKTKYHESGYADHAGISLTANSAFTSFAVTGTAIDFSGKTSSAVVKLNATGGIVWNKLYNDPGFDVDVACEIRMDNSGNIYVAGTNAFSGIYYDPHKVWSVKYGSASGNLIYSNYYKNIQDSTYGLTSAVRFFLDNTNHTYIAGHTNGLAYTIDDAVLLRYNTNGSADYDVYFDGIDDGDDKATHILMDVNGNICAAGTMLNGVTSQDVWIGQYDPMGNLLWQNSYDELNKVNSLVSFGSDATGNLFILNRNGISYFGDTTKFSVVKFNNAGSLQWYSQANYIANAMKVNSAGESFVAGVKDTSGFTDFFVQKFSPAGNLVWQNIPGAGAGQKIFTKAVDVDGSGNMYVAGNWMNASGKYFMRVQKYTNGNLVWTKNISGLDSTKMQNVVDLQLSGTSLYLMGSGFTTTFADTNIIAASLDLNGTVLWRQSYNINGSVAEAGEKMSINGNTIAIAGHQENGTYSSVLRILKISGVNGNLLWNNNSFSSFLNIQMGGVSLSPTGEIIYSYTDNANFNSSDIYTEKVDAAGNILWTKIYDGPSSKNDQSNAMVESNGRIYLAGFAKVSGGGISPDILVLKYCDIAQPTVTLNGAQTICPGTQVSLSASAGVNYLWYPNMETTQSITANAQAYYSAVVSETDGCSKQSDSILISVKALPAAPELCMVTVDAASTHNILFWDRTPFMGAGVIGFKIYREDLTNIYTYIGASSIDSAGEYHDFGANPNVTTKRYKISAVDSCNNESAMGNFHNTIFFTGNGSGTFNWNTYTIENQPNPVSYYVLYRDSASSGIWDSIGSTAGTQNVLNDPNFSLYPYGSYRVETIWNISCDPSRAIINTSRSNIKNIVNPTLNTNEVMTGNEFDIYPNPAKDQLNISLGRNLQGEKITAELFDITGRLVKSELITNDKTVWNIEQFSAGAYTLRLLRNSTSVGIKKILKD